MALGRGGIALGAAAAYVALRKPKKPEAVLANPTLGDHGMIYMDYNATTPIDPRVAEAMQPFLREGFGNELSTRSVSSRRRASRARASGQPGRCREPRRDRVHHAAPNPSTP